MDRVKPGTIAEGVALGTAQAEALLAAVKAKPGMGLRGWLHRCIGHRWYVEENGIAHDLHFVLFRCGCGAARMIGKAVG